MEYPQVSDGGNGLQIWNVAANTMNKQSWTADKGVVLQLGGLGREQTPHCKYHLATKCYTQPQMWRALVNMAMNLQIP
jgi:hypothetical protein